MRNDSSAFPGSRRHLLALAAVAVPHMPARAAEFREISWDDLVPKDWDPMKGSMGVSAYTMVASRVEAYRAK